MVENKIDYKKLLQEAFEKDGIISDCYSMFYDFSFINCLLAISQLKKTAPINTFKGWAEMGRKIKRGEKAIFLRMPIKIKEKIDENEEIEEEKTIYLLKNRWFGFYQTEAIKEQTDEQKEEENKYLNNKTIDFSIDNILKNLKINLVDFEEINGNVQGYAFKNNIVLNPLCEDKTKTTIHEIAHIVLGHTDKENSRSILKHSIKEVEAEGVAYIICNILNNTKNLIKSRGYIQAYLSDLDEKQKEEASKNIIKTASVILKNGKAQPLHKSPLPFYFLLII